MNDILQLATYKPQPPEGTLFFSSLVSIGTGYPLRGKIIPDWDSPHKIVQIKDLDAENGINLTTLTPIRLTLKREPNFLVQGDILIVGRGNRVYAALVEEDLPNIVAAPTLFHCRPFKERTEVLPAFLVWYINSIRGQDLLNRWLFRSSSLAIRKPALNRFPVIIPPLVNQRKILKVAALHKREVEISKQLLAHRTGWVAAMLDKALSIKTPTSDEGL